MEPTNPSNPLLSLSTFIHQHCVRLRAEFATRLGDTTRALASNLPPGPNNRKLRPAPLFASVSQPKHSTAAGTLSPEHVAKTLAGTSVFTVSNTNNEFVLISDPDGSKSISLLCFRQEDAEAFLAQVRLRRRELRSEAKVVPITLDQVYMLKVEGIAFRFLPDPVQIRNALELKSSDTRSSFDGVPVFQSDLLVVKKKNKRYCPIYFYKEDIEKELSKVSKASRGPGLAQHIRVSDMQPLSFSALSYRKV
ncbi:hypothetical protein MANES_05G173500v8 [Manihot esculenta]|uniref:Uncharacterized protein n=1 Tax=Manihot esculenta TaxID=3983 RepID=A0ACB7HSU0_MANES|nr:hypothetical protein MANES_05G173500v8 [Manihot esculenta]